MLTRRFLNLLQGRLALMKRDVWAFEFANLCEGEESGEEGLCLRGRGQIVCVCVQGRGGVREGERDSISEL